jgi:hypothetical protein
MNHICGTEQPSKEAQLEINRSLDLYKTKINKTIQPLLIPVCIYVKSDPISETEIINFIKSLNDYFNQIDNNYDSNRSFLNTYTYTGPNRTVFDKIKTQYNAFYTLTNKINVFFYLKSVVRETKLINDDLNGTVTSSVRNTIIKRKTVGLNIVYDVPPENYGITLNVWMVNFIPANGKRLLGYAQYPWSLVTSPEYDGIVIDRRTINNDIFVNKTAVHEIGHWLGLYHTFQLEGDRIDDTPQQTDASVGNPLDDKEPILWPTNDAGDLVMFVNYMDYTNDPCMCMFTTGQCNKMNLCNLIFRRGLVNYIPLTNPTITISIKNFKRVGSNYFFNNTSVVKLTHNFVNRNGSLPNTIKLLKNNILVSNTLYTISGKVITVKPVITNTGTFKIRIIDALSTVYSNGFLLTYVDIPTVSNITLVKGILRGTVTNTSNKLVTVAVTIRNKTYTVRTNKNISVNVIGAGLVKKRKYTFIIRTNNTIFTAYKSIILTY